MATKLGRLMLIEAVGHEECVKKKRMVDWGQEVRY